LLKHQPFIIVLPDLASAEAIPYNLFLIIGHWVIMVAVIIFAEQAFRRLTDCQRSTRETPRAMYRDRYFFSGFYNMARF